MVPAVELGRRMKTGGLLLLCFILLAGVSGCAMQQYLASPFRPRCVLPPEITEQQLIAWLNQQTAQVRNWRSTNVRVSSSSGGIPVRLSAVLAVERPANFRMMAKSIAGREADMGANAEQFWFWMRRTEPRHVFTVHRTQMAAVRQQMQMPLDPDWLMQVLGVMPLPEGDVFLQPREPDSNLLALVVEGFSPTGEPVRRVIQVDACHGRVITQSLHDSRGQLLARATFNDYRPCSGSEILLAHRIEFDWPQTGAAMTLTIGSIDVNNAALPEQLWTIPDIPGYPKHELGRHMAGGIAPAGARDSYVPHAAGGSSQVMQASAAAMAYGETATEPEWSEEPPFEDEAAPFSTAENDDRVARPLPPGDAAAGAYGAGGTSPGSIGRAAATNGAAPFPEGAFNESPRSTDSSPGRARLEGFPPPARNEDAKLPRPSPPGDNAPTGRVTLPAVRPF